MDQPKVRLFSALSLCLRVCLSLDLVFSLSFFLSPSLSFVCTRAVAIPLALSLALLSPACSLPVSFFHSLSFLLVPPLSPAYQCACQRFVSPPSVCDSCPPHLSFPFSDSLALHARPVHCRVARAQALGLCLSCRVLLLLSLSVSL